MIDVLYFKDRYIDIERFCMTPVSSSFCMQNRYSICQKHWDR